MCTVLLPPGVNPIAVNKYIIYHISYTISYHLMSWHVMSCRVVSCRVVSCHVMSCHVILYYIILYRIVSYIISCHVVSYHISYHIITSYHIIYHIAYIMSCHVMSCYDSSKHTLRFIKRHEINPLEGLGLHYNRCENLRSRVIYLEILKICHSIFELLEPILHVLLIISSSKAILIPHDSVESLSSQK